MNGKQFSKIRNTYPAEVKKQIEKELRKKMYQGWVHLPSVLKSRPKWFPFKLWIFLMGFFIKIGKEKTGQEVPIAVPKK